ncbi:carbon storage regulator CsrA [Salibacterium qingdaonense]|uniref:Translational regulator CsrA n=1 Tax=Salibacterium qingdaonense TaxID=266892 RepID=A0A1I4L0J7_9BACI|nr:carbon storage regulator CsrA [Salibacterium qingdaonense]SFL84353.1 carbon storage regulator, CsrA [Salibacterium qingdaonense]
MLVLTRKPNESIQIGEDIEIKVIAVEGDQVKLGINAPGHVDIHRHEVYLSIQEENNEAAGYDNLSILEALSQQMKK